MWLLQDSDLVLSEGAPEGVPNLYRRENCGAGKGSQELLTTVPAPDYGIDTEPEGVEYVPEPQGYTPDGCSVFRANASLTPDADPEKGIYQLYEHCPGEQLRLISVLPDGAAAAVHSSLGTAMASPAGNFREDSVAGAVAAGGERLFWTADSSSGNGTGSQAGTIYLRANPTAEPSASGACDEPGKACSLQVSPSDSFFWTANPAGTLAIYQTGGQLFEAEISEEAGVLSAGSTLIAGGIGGSARSQHRRDAHLPHLQRSPGTRGESRPAQPLPLRAGGGFRAGGRSATVRGRQPQRRLPHRPGQPRRRAPRLHVTSQPHRLRQRRRRQRRAGLRGLPL